MSSNMSSRAGNAELGSDSNIVIVIKQVAMSVHGGARFYTVLAARYPSYPQLI